MAGCLEIAFWKSFAVTEIKSASAGDDNNSKPKAGCNNLLRSLNSEEDTMLQKQQKEPRDNKAVKGPKLFPGVATIELTMSDFPMHSLVLGFSLAGFPMAS